MRIQHNVMAMGAYRNYTNNVSAMKKNLEKLSSGYKINRAGDDAAGLAISEKMRAQITGLETAQKNAKDGISLVQTAEGALTEVHDMLNRMVELATMSANGTYDNDTDRAQLQKEMDQLKSEINRIADSSNFNGIKLLDGSMAKGADAAAYSSVGTSEIADMMLPAMTAAEQNGAAADVAGTKTVLEKDGVGKTVPQFTISFDGMSYTADADNTDLGLKVNDADVAPASGKVMTAGTTYDSAKLAELYDGATVDVDGIEYTAKADGSKIVFKPTNEETTGKINDALKIDWNKTPETPSEMFADSVPSLTVTQTQEGKEAVAKGTVTTGTVTSATSVAPADGAKAKYTLDFSAVEIDTSSGSLFKITVGSTSKDVELTGDADGKLTADDREAIRAAFDDQIADGKGTKYAATLDADGKLVLEAKTAGDATTTNTALTGTPAVAAADADQAAQADTWTVQVDTATAAADGKLSLKLGGNTYEIEVAKGNDQDVIAGAIADAINKQGLMDGKAGVYTATAATGTVTITAASAGASGLDLEGAALKESGGAGAVGAVGYINVATQNVVVSDDGSGDQLASTSIDLGEYFKDGAQITLGDQTYTIALGSDSAYKDSANVVYLADPNTDVDTIASKLTEVAKNNATFTVGHDKADGKGTITLKQLQSAKESTDMSTREKLASYIGISTVSNADAVSGGKGLTLQIGDTADSFNQLNVSIKDMHTASLGLDSISIADQDSAATAINAIKSAINKVSDVRGTLGATQNRLDHTINNLSVMTENIQDAESTIRDVDIAEEMMAYTKNNILIQSAQAMLAQANQVPQGVLQLLQ